MEKNSKPWRDLDLIPTMPNIELVRVIFIYYNVPMFQCPMFQCFMFLDQFLSSYRAKTHTHINTHTHMDAHKDSDKYSIVAFCKNATVTRKRFSEKNNSCVYK